MQSKSLDDISHKIDLKNSLENRPKFKLLLVQNDKAMQVLQNQALPQGEEEWKKEVFELSNEFYLLHIVDKQIRFNKSFDKYIKEGIQFRLINQQNALHIISLVKDLKKIINNNGANDLPPPHHQTSVNSNSNNSNTRAMTEENNKFTQQTQFQQQLQNLQQPLIQINKNYSKCRNTNYKNHYSNIGNNKSNNINIRNSPLQNQEEEEEEEESKIQAEEDQNDEHLYQRIAQEKQQQQQQQWYTIQQLIIKTAQEYLESNENLDALVQWKLSVAISTNKVFQRFDISEFQRVLLQCLPFLEQLIDGRRKQLLNIQSKVTEKEEEYQFFQKPPPSRKYQQKNNHKKSGVASIYSSSPSPSFQSIKSSCNNNNSPSSATILKTPNSNDNNSNSSYNKSNKRINLNKFAKDNVSAQLVTNKRAIIKNDKWQLQQKQHQVKDNESISSSRNNTKQQDKRGKQQQQQSKIPLSNQNKQQQQLSPQEEQELFGSYKLTRSQLKQLLQNHDDNDNDNNHQTQQ